MVDVGPQGDSDCVSSRVLVVDDDASFRRVAAALLRARGYEVVGEAADAREALLAAGALSPAAVLLDVHLPDRNGVSLAADLRSVVPGVRILLTSADAEAVWLEHYPSLKEIAFVAKSDLVTTNLGPLLDT
jgi:DNA-binding NarL/FixJ family response regulator